MPPTLSTDPATALFAALVAVVLALVVSLGSGPLLRSLSEPPDEELVDAPAPRYAELPARWFAVALGVSVVMACLVVIGRLPPTGWPAWVGVCTLGVLLGWVDARTTWLPYGPMVALWALTALGTAVVVALAWPSSGAAALLVPAAVGAGAGGLFWLIHGLSRGALGFGDVRLVVPLAVAAATVSLDVALTGLVIGTGAAAMYALGRLLLRRRGEFAYGPWLVVGCLAGVLVAG